MSVLDDKFTIIQLSIVYEIIALLLYILLKRLRFNSVVQLCYLAALVCSFIQFATTNPYEYNPDSNGHIDYVNFIAVNWWLPPPTGWQTHHPPLFYITAAIFSSIGHHLGASPLYSARIAPLLYYYGAMVFAGLLLRRFVEKSSIFYICLLTILFWPAAVHNSVKISNDVGELFFMAGFVYFLSGWLKDNQDRQLTWAIIFTGGAMATKVSGMLAVFVLFSFIFYRLVKKQCTFNMLLKRPIQLALVLLIIGCGNFARIYYWRDNSNINIKWILNRDDNLQGWYDFVDNNPFNYLYFSYHDYLYDPFPQLWNKFPEAHLVINVLLKTLLYDGITNHKDGLLLAQLVNFMFLGCIVYLAAIMIQNRRDLFKDASFNAVAYTALFAIVMVLCCRAVSPTSNAGGGRFIYIFVVLFITMFGHIITKLCRGNLYRSTDNLGFFMLSFFCVCTISFSVTRWGWPIEFSTILFKPPSWIK